VANFDERKKQELLNEKGIIRHKLKIEAAVNNAQLFLEVQQEFDSFSNYIWRFVGGKTIQNNHQNTTEIPTKTKESYQMSRDLQKRGFKFVGPTICYAFMQAVGLVNDHTVDCFRYAQLTN
jgi:DNA-3-methyladenine glycosylase I